MMLAQIRRRAREHLHGRPGHRFQDRYHMAKQGKREAAPQRIANLAMALVALAIAAVLVVFPGPAIPFFLIAGVLLAAESLWIAKLMDWLEVKFRAAWKWGKKRWDRLPHPARVTLKILAPCVSITCAILTWHFLRG
jgi:hypothetical protein